MNSNSLFLNTQRGSALLMTMAFMILGLGLTLAFLNSARNHLSQSSFSLDSTDANYQAEAQYESAKAKIDRAVDAITFNGKLRYPSASASLAANGERFDVINNLYATDTNNNNSALDEALNFLRDAVRAQAYSSQGTLNANHEFAYFDSGNNPAFPTTWTDPDPNDDKYVEWKFSFNPLRVESQIASDPKSITFEYEYLVQVRGYGRNRFTTREYEDSGVISVSVEGRPFSQWALFMDSMLNQNGSTLYFAGGNTSAQAQEVYGGPVHVNQKPNFYGHPYFSGYFTSSIAENLWNYVSATNYTGCPSQCPTFEDNKAGGVPSVSMPSAMFNTHRLAAGDTSSTASTNNAQPTVAEMKSFLTYHADGTFNQALTSIPNGIYLPVNNLASNVPSGGIYVEGNAEVTMNVVTGESDVNTYSSSSAWTQIQPSHQSCKFQQIKINSTSAASTARDILIADDPCNVTYVFNANNYAAAPSILNGRINGTIHVNGAISKLGGASRTRPAVAQDFALTVSALKDIYITNDLQYEDVEYVTATADGSMGTTPVANAYGDLNGSGISPTNPDIAATVSEDSQTILGIISTQKNVLIYVPTPYNASTSAPNDINLHGAIYAGNSNAYDSSTGVGCGANTANKKGCGFGVLNYSASGTPNKGNIKFFGGISEYKDQTTATISGSTLKGYASRYFYDQRLYDGISPPAFPISNFPNAYGSIRRMKSYRLAQQED